MTVQTQDQNTQSIWAWKNTAHITKNVMEVGFAVAAVLIAGTAIYTAAKGVALSSALPAFLANPWVIAAIVSCVAIYFIAKAVSSWQQTFDMRDLKANIGNGKDGQPGQKGKEADFSVLLGDAVKGGTISVEESEKDGNKTQKLLLNLSKADYDALVRNKQSDSAILYVLLADRSVEVKFNPHDVNNDACKIEIADQAEIGTKRKELDMAEEANSLKVAVSNKNHEALKVDVSAKLADVAIEGAVKKAIA